MFPWADAQAEDGNAGYSGAKGRTGSLRRAGSKIVDNALMTAAGVQQPQAQQHASELFDMGNRMETKGQRNALGTLDINGGIKRNRFGAVMSLDPRLADRAAGGAKPTE